MIRSSDLFFAGMLTLTLTARSIHNASLPPCPGGASRERGISYGLPRLPRERDMKVISR